jgi:GLPGLI family protein
MKHFTLLIALLCICNLLQAQNAHFTTSGTIEFERSINIYAVIKKQINKDNESFMQQAFDAYKKANPQFKKQKSVLTFSKDKALFVPVADEDAGGNNFFWSADPTTQQNNTIFTDLTTNISITQKKAFEETFLVKDTARKINWKITDEKRDIAGYSCRRANAVIMDSVYVVAFYTDEIPLSGGPESFTGLPGMILGVALPHDNITWFATKVTDMPVPDSKMPIPKKGKPVNNKQLREKLDDAMKDWGTEGKSFLKTLLL